MIRFGEIERMRKRSGGLGEKGAKARAQRVVFVSLQACSCAGAQILMCVT